MVKMVKTPNRLLHHRLHLPVVFNAPLAILVLLVLQETQVLKV
jgi:hypothetical protein